MRRRTPLVILAAVLALVGLVAVGFTYASLPTRVTIAVGPAGSDNDRLVVALQQLLQRERSGVRLQVITTAGLAASAAALQNRTATLAVVRSDVDYPPDGLVLANVRRDVVVLMTAPNSDIAQVGDLRGRRIGIVGAPATTPPLLRRVLQDYEVRESEYVVVPLPADEAGPALRDGRVEVIATVSNAAGRQLAELAMHVGEALGAAPRYLAVTQAAAIARRTPAIEEAEIVRGAFGGTPPRPAESVQTVGVVHRLVAHRTADESTVAALTQLLFALRPALANELPLAAQMEAPDTDRGAQVPVHPGAIQYIEGNIRTFFDRFSDWFYLIIMVVGLIGSGVAGVASFAQSHEHGRKMSELGELVRLLAAARVADGPARLDAVEAEVDRLFAATLERIAARELDSAQIAAFTLAFDQVRRGIADRRLVLAAPPGRLAPAIG